MNRSAADWAGNIGAFLLVIVVNLMATAVPIGGQTTGEISDDYPSLFTPAGYVFSIWGLIYLGLGAFVVWQALPSQRANHNISAIRLPFLVNCASNAAWIFAWHYGQLLLSLVLMFAILGSLVQIYRTLRIGVSDVAALERWIMHTPFSVYLGWITVATIANVSIVQLDRGWDELGFDAVTWTVIKIAIAGSVAATVLFRRRDMAFALVTVWAAAGIATKHASTPTVAGAASAIAILGALLVASELIARLRSVLVQ